MAAAIISITIALLPLFIRISNVDLNRESKDFLFIPITLLIISLLNQNRKLPMIFMPIIGYVSLQILLNQYNPKSLNVIHHSLFIFSGMFLFISILRSDIDYEYIYNGMIVGSVVQSVIAICQYYGFDLYFYLISIAIRSKQSSTGSGCGYMLGSFGNSNLLASYLAICTLAFFKNKKTIILSIVPIYTLILTQTYMGIAPLIAGLFYLINSKFNIISKAKIYIVTILSMIIVPFFDIGIDSGRFPVWRIILKTSSLKHWLIGMGPGWFPDQEIGTPAIPDVPFLQEHNSYLTMFNFFGLFGFLLLLPIFIKFLKHKTDDFLLESILFIIFCNFWGHFAIQQSTVMIIIIPLLAMQLRKVYENK